MIILKKKKEKKRKILSKLKVERRLIGLCSRSIKNGLKKRDRLDHFQTLYGEKGTIMNLQAVESTSVS